MKTAETWFHLVRDNKMRRRLLDDLLPEKASMVYSSLENAIRGAIDFPLSNMGYEYWEHKAIMAKEGLIAVIERSNTTRDYVSYTFDGDNFIAIDGTGKAILNFAYEKDEFPIKEFPTAMKAVEFMKTEGHEDFQICQVQYKTEKRCAE